MVGAEKISAPAISRRNRVLRVVDSARPEGRFQPAPQQPEQIIVTMDLDLPEDRVSGAELDLIEQHLGELLLQMLRAGDEAKE
jgi:hypothetical protein